MIVDYGRSSSPTESKSTVMSSMSEATKRNTFKYRTGQLHNRRIAFLRKQRYMSEETVARDMRCPLCTENESGSNILQEDAYIGM